MNDLAAPDHSVETTRLFLPRLTEKDAGDFAALFEGDWGAVKQTGQLPFPATTAAMQTWIRRHTGPGGHAFLLRRKIDRAAIGAIGFGGRGPILELGYALGRDSWGQGYATEATVAMIDMRRAPLVSVASRLIALSKTRHRPGCWRKQGFPKLARSSGNIRSAAACVV